jgi:ligand-binding sensor protein
MSRTIAALSAGELDKSHTENRRLLQREGSAFGDKQLVEALGCSKMYRDYKRTFTEATGLPLALRPVEFFGLPFHGRKNENAFCAFLPNRKASCVFCLRTQTRAGAQPNGQPRSVRCPFVLIETTVPIRLGERVIGFLCTGQVFTQSPAVPLFKKSIHRLFPKASTSEKKAFQLWQKTPFISRSKYEATVQLLNFFAKQLSALHHGKES